MIARKTGSVEGKVGFRHPAGRLALRSLPVRLRGSVRLEGACASTFFARWMPAMSPASARMTGPSPARSWWRTILPLISDHLLCSILAEIPPDASQSGQHLGCRAPGQLGRAGIARPGGHRTDRTSLSQAPGPAGRLAGGRPPAAQGHPLEFCARRLR